MTEPASDDLLTFWRRCSNDGRDDQLLDSRLDRPGLRALIARLDAAEKERDWWRHKDMNATMAEGALNAIHQLLDSSGIPRGTYGDDHVCNLVVMYNKVKKDLTDLQHDAERAAKTMTELATENERLRNNRHPCPRCGISVWIDRTCNACGWPGATFR